MATPVVSVIIPCYKQSHFLSDCIASLQKQTFFDWEAIIVDDGSPDDTVAVAQRLAHEDTRVRLLSKPNGGLSSARNAGLALARGRFIQFLDADDLLLPRKFEVHLHMLQKLPAGTVSYTDYFHGAEHSPTERVSGYKIDCNFRMPRPVLDFAARWEHYFSIPIHAALFPREVLPNEVEVFDTRLANHEDWDFWMRVCPRVRSFELINQEMAIYRFSQRSMSRNGHVMWSGFQSAIRKQQLLWDHDPEVLSCLSRLSIWNDLTHGKGWAGRIDRMMKHRLVRRLRLLSILSLAVDKNDPALRC